MLNAILQGQSMISLILTAFSILVMIFVIFPLHESAHALVALWLGDDTADRQGRISLNPFSHLDPLGTLGMVLFGIGWAKPVPVNTARCRKVKSQKTAMALTAAAGPLANILSALVFMIIQKIILVTVAPSDARSYVTLALYFIIDIDIFNGVFNLLPVPPFDGSRILLAFLPTKYYFGIMKYEQYIMIALLVLMWTGYLSIPFQILSNWVYNLLDLMTGFIV